MRSNRQYSTGLVSVIIPTRNRANLLRETLESVLEQGYRPIEIVVVDDGSTDKTDGVVAELSKVLGEGVSLAFVRQNHEGAPAARNRGLSMCRGEFVQFLDSDDLLHPDKLSAQVEAIERTEADVATCYQKLFRLNIDDMEVIHQFGLGTDLLAGFIRANGWNSSTALYRREVLNGIGDWNTELSIMQDFEYSCRVCMQHIRVTEVNRVLFYYRQAELGQSISEQRPEVRARGVLVALSSVEQHARQQETVWTDAVRCALAIRYRWVYQDLAKTGQKAAEAWRRSWRLSSLAHKGRLIIVTILAAIKRKRMP